MKLLALAVLLAVMQAPPPVPRKTADKPTRGSHDIKQNPKDDKHSLEARPPLPGSTSDDQHERRNQSSHDAAETVVIREQAPVSGRDVWDKAYVVFTGLLVIVGGIGVIYAVKTLNAIKRQAKANEEQLTEIQQSAEKTDRMIVLAAQEAENGKLATEAAKKSADAAVDNAQAALLSARATINSERPWFLIRITTTNSDSDVQGIPLHLGFNVSFHNCGKTPAEVVAFDQHPECRQNTEDLPSPPEYTREGHVMTHTRMVPANGLWQDPGESSFYAESFLLEDQWADIRYSKRRLIYWGRLQYRDLIEQPKTIHVLEKPASAMIHETCFCYFWSLRMNEFLICGPLGYNKHT